jgi:hypothetical protein
VDGLSAFHFLWSITFCATVINPAVNVGMQSAKYNMANVVF